MNKRSGRAEVEVFWCVVVHPYLTSVRTSLNLPYSGVYYVKNWTNCNDSPFCTCFKQEAIQMDRYG